MLPTTITGRIRVKVRVTNPLTVLVWLSPPLTQPRVRVSSHTLSRMAVVKGVMASNPTRSHVAIEEAMDPVTHGAVGVTPAETRPNGSVIYARHQSIYLTTARTSLAAVVIRPVTRVLLSRPG